MGRPSPLLRCAPPKCRRILVDRATAIATDRSWRQWSGAPLSGLTLDASAARPHSDDEIYKLGHEREALQVPLARVDPAGAELMRGLASSRAPPPPFYSRRGR